MRLCAALSPPRDVLAELEAAVAPLRPDWPGLRWASRDRWHVTLAFLGQVDPARLDGLAVRLERAAARHQSQRLLIGRSGAFPSPSRARGLIAHVKSADGARARLAALAASVAAGARRAGAPPPDEGRRYRPHLTLARSQQPADLTELVGSLSGLRGTPWTAAEIDLIESHLGPKPRYEKLGTWPLRSDVVVQDLRGAGEVA